jgi:predicted  nucleic acid-binding Zn-ribbon protein
MVVHALQCTDCEETRVGRDTDDGITPIQESCPDCGSKSFTPLARKQSN